MKCELCDKSAAPLRTGVCVPYICYVSLWLHTPTKAHGCLQVEATVIFAINQNDGGSSLLLHRLRYTVSAIFFCFSESHRKCYNESL